MENKQTAVEWLASYIKGITDLNCDEIIEQAKQMEKEQIIRSNSIGYNDGIAYANGMECEYESALQYYEQNYGGQE